MSSNGGHADEMGQLISLIDLDVLPAQCGLTFEGTVKSGFSVRASRADGRLSFPRPVTGRPMKWEDFVWQDEPTSFTPRRRWPPRWITRWYDHD